MNIAAAKSCFLNPLLNQKIRIFRGIFESAVIMKTVLKRVGCQYQGFNSCLVNDLSSILTVTAPPPPDSHLINLWSHVVKRVWGGMCETLRRVCVEGGVSCYVSVLLTQTWQNPPHPPPTQLLLLCRAVKKSHFVVLVKFFITMGLYAKT